ncbi:hypothetical protein [Halopseudomonas xinjiangensis]|uniref:hypothetical protein n=1 Tax=Halopseudomonas xinjiangensis TaxID=487184 RepID=UPI0018D2CFB4|nr:hypothetical protein [Halopseudomonas xinjiangensis]
MNISLTLLGDILSGLALIVGALSYFLGRRKTQTPVIAGFAACAALGHPAVRSCLSGCAAFQARRSLTVPSTGGQV